MLLLSVDKRVGRNRDDRIKHSFGLMRLGSWRERPATYALYRRLPGARLVRLFLPLPLPLPD